MNRHSSDQDPFFAGLSRRSFLAASTAAATALIAKPTFGAPGDPATAPSAPPAAAPASTHFTLPPLGYAFDALEPRIDAQTMQIHHDKHHGTYVANLNKLVPANPMLAEMTLEKLLADNCAAVPEAIRTAVRNNGGGHHNHSLFWQILTPRAKDAGAKPEGALNAAISADLGGMEKLVKDLSAAATARFGSGWAWLVLKENKLAITSTANQDSPLMEGAIPLLGLDVWEHAYYLKYQNRRPEYIAAFWEVVNWKVVGDKYDAARK